MRCLLIAAFVWTFAAFIGFIVLPMYSDGSTLFAINGSGAFAGIGIPILISSVPLVLRKARVPAGVAMAAFVVIAGGSIGLFYTPSAVMLLWPHSNPAGRTE